MKDFQPGRDTGSAGSAPADIDFEAEHRPEVSRRASNAALRRYVQKQAISGASLEATHEAAAKGVASPTTSLPFADKIQASFGPSHDVSQINAHVGGDSASAMGANAYASGNHVVFDKSPDLHTAAHEAAHVVQQAQGVNLYGGVGEAGDSYERHADAVADRVVAGQSAADLLGPSSGSVGRHAVQMKATDAEVADDKRLSEANAAKAYTTAISRATQKIQLATTLVEEWLGTPIPEQGLTFHNKAFREQYSHVSDEISHLGFELADESMSALPDAARIQATVPRFQIAVENFIARYQEAVEFTQSHGDPVTAGGSATRFGDFTHVLVEANKRVSRPYIAGTPHLEPIKVNSVPAGKAKKDGEAAHPEIDELTNKSFYTSLEVLADTGFYLDEMGDDRETELEMSRGVQRAQGTAIEAARLMKSISSTTKDNNKELNVKGKRGIEALRRFLDRKAGIKANAEVLLSHAADLYTWLSSK